MILSTLSWRRKTEDQRSQLVSQASQKPILFCSNSTLGLCRSPGAWKTRPMPSTGSLLPRAGASPEQPPMPLQPPSRTCPASHGTGCSHGPAPCQLTYLGSLHLGTGLANKTLQKSLSNERSLVKATQDCHTELGPWLLCGAGQGSLLHPAGAGKGLPPSQ